VLAWVEASHGWFADAGAKPPLPSLKGDSSCGQRKQRRLDPSLTEVETRLCPASTDGSVASDDTDSSKSWEESVTNDLDE